MNETEETEITNEAKWILTIRRSPFPIIVIIVLILSAILIVAFYEIQPYVQNAKIKSAYGDINGIELVLTIILSDTGLNCAADLFDPNEVADYLADGIVQGGTEPIRIMGVLTTEQFQRAQDMYTSALTALIKYGKNVLTQRSEDIGIAYSQILRDDMIEKLGNEYLDDLGKDPWGNPYQIFPGPWPANRDPSAKRSEPNGNLNVFRIYRVPSIAIAVPGSRSLTGRLDALTVNYDPASPDSPPHEIAYKGEEQYPINGFSAPTCMMAFIYSFGPNMVSGQAIYSNCGYSWDSYDKNQAPQLWGGGDDISNWDVPFGLDWGCE